MMYDPDVATEIRQISNDSAGNMVGHVIASQVMFANNILIPFATMIPHLIGMGWDVASDLYSGTSESTPSQSAPKPPMSSGASTM